MSITFVGMAGRSSGIVRGLQLVECNDKNNFLDRDRMTIYGKDKKILKNVIFVRNYNKSFAKSLKEKGHTIGYDIIDRPVADLHRLQNSNKKAENIDWSTLCDENIDYYIVTNSLAKIELSKVSEKPIYVIPHHVVSNKLNNQEKKEKIKVLGYIGTKDQLYCREELIEYCNKNKLSFYENHPKSQSHCIEDLKKIDLGIIFLEKNKRTDFVLKYKPNQKLSNFQCFGIPTICVPYKSYVEFSEPDSCIFVTKKEQMFNAIDELIKNEELRKKIINNGYKSAEKLLVKNIINLYNDIKELK